MSYKKIGIVVADKDEFEPFINSLDCPKNITTPFKSAFEFMCGSASVTALLCGIGKVNAATAAMYLIDSGCDFILNFGLSGGLKGIGRGEYILPESFLEHDFDLTLLGYKPCEKPRQTYIYSAHKETIDKIVKAGIAVPGGTAVCGDRFISSDIDREFLIKTFSANSCDMETAAIASVCSITGIPFVSLRRISDDASNNATEVYRDIKKDDGIPLSDASYSCLKIICEA
ncbi:MAG: 5'-methylthioadenosine/S-adenosylhomocysteine nucleosidase [Clostridia bacterium]|nr:5'-methylthioadenosine/S-adenosylhomocysteine nucleosidase [Clostridia bacterium]